MIVYQFFFGKLNIVKQKRKGKKVKQKSEWKFIFVQWLKKTVKLYRRIQNYSDIS